MKTNLRMLVSLAAVAAVAAASVACGPPQRRSEWRTRAPATPCTTDADCNGGTCAVDPAVSAGQPSQGTCSQAPLPALPPGGGGTDGGLPPGHPSVPGHPGSPLSQPSPSDIHI